MPYRPTLRQLEYIVALDNLRHFGKAALHCHVSQPTLSVQVGLVEKALGVTLFERTPSSVVTTPVGFEVARGARLALAAVDDIVEGAAGDTKALGGIIRLATAPTFGPYFLPRFLPGLHRKFPTLKIYIREDRPVDIEDAVAAGALDCGLGPAPERSGLTFRRIGDEKLFLGVPADHRLAGRHSVAISDLVDEKLLALGSGHRLMENVRHLAEAAGAVVIDDYEGTSLDSIRQMVSIGMGCSLFPELYARAEFRKDDDVKLLVIQDWSEKREVGFYWRLNSGRQAHYQRLADQAGKIAQEAGIA
jgi:LysR family transcriptional regulator, hydrogen peroxide-inducible genes activator